MVAEALHDTAESDVARLTSELSAALKSTWPACTLQALAAR